MESTDEDSPGEPSGTLEGLRHQWAECLEIYSSDKPFTAGPLRGSRLRIESGENPVLDILFSNSSQLELFLSDPRNKTDLRAFLISRLETETSFSLEFSANNSEMPMATAVSGPESLDELCQREPIIKTLLDLFEGRVLDSIG